MSDLMKDWQKAKQDLAQAKRWNDLPKGPRYMNDSFAVMHAHGSKAPVLVRCGQSHAGAQNYHPSPEGLNGAIQKYLVTNWDKIAPDVFSILEQQEKKACIACQEYVDSLQSEIDKAKEGAQ